MAVKIGINGVGRIGRMVFRAAAAHPEVEVVAINDLTDARSLANLLKYDSARGVYPGEVGSDADALIVNGVRVPVTAERNPTKLDWAASGVQIVVESTGIMRDRQAAEQHLTVGAEKVLIAGPATNPDGVFVVGVNDQTYDPAQHHILSLDSCVTNCLAPLCQVLVDQFGVENVFVTAIHDFTHDEGNAGRQKSGNGAGKKSLDMMRTPSGMTAALGTVIPELAGNVSGWFLRAPTPDSSLIDLTVQLKHEASAAAINAAMIQAAEGQLKGVLEFSIDPVTSEMIADNPYSSILDCGLTTARGRMVKLYAWYDGEWGYSNRIVDMVYRMSQVRSANSVTKDKALV
ncbi:MAG: type I glyceraldehyde-3-phosphate dehydrogenase [bacterium]